MSSYLVKLIDITKLFGTRQALKGITLDLYYGEIVSLLGANGAGKTTLSSILATIRPPTSGDILYNGSSIYSDIVSYRRVLGYCAQRPNLNINLTVEQNLQRAGLYYGMSAQDITERIAVLAKELMFKEYLTAKPAALSGGFKQRIMIARGIIHRPKLVILDEPTVALDPHIRRSLWDYIIAMKKEGMCVLLTTHYLEEAEVLSDRVVVMDNGKVRMVDSPKNLMATFAKESLEDVFMALMGQTE